MTPSLIALSAPAKTRSATWDDYLTQLANSEIEDCRVFFNNGSLWVEMGNEGINHARFCDLITFIFGIWFMEQPDIEFDALSGCIIASAGKQGAAPDKVLYVGGNIPQWEVGKPRRIDLETCRPPDLVAEISDTTLSTDLDEKKQLYAAMGILEYWVIDVRGRQIWAFQLVDDRYEDCQISLVLAGLPIDLLSETLQQVDRGNGAAVRWFAQRLVSTKIEIE
jgi:Uma2 family endonuclease